MFFKQFDLISPDITLYFKGQEKHSSIVSGIISLLIIILGSSLGIIVAGDFFLKKNPTTFQNEKTVLDSGILYLSHNYFIHLLELEESINKINYFYDNKLLTIIGIESNKSISYSLLRIEEIDHWIYERCDEYDFSNKYFFKNIEILNYSNYICIKKLFNATLNKTFNQNDNQFRYPQIKHGEENELNSMYYIGIFKCINYSYNNNNCYNDNNIDNLIQKGKIYLSFKIHYLENYIDIENYKNPIEYFFRTQKIYYYDHSSEIIKLYYNPLKIKTDDGILFDTENILNLYSLDHIEDTFQSDFSGNLYAIFNFRMKNKLKIINRAYKKIQDIAGAVDGIVELLTLICEFINVTFYNQFQVVNDFNELIEGKVTKLKKRNFNFYENCFNNEINNIHHHVKTYSSGKNNNITSSTSRLPFNNNFLKLNIVNNNSINESINSFKNFQIQLLISFKKISWIEYMCNFFKTKKYKNKYVEEIKQKREEILSEERIFKDYFSIKVMKEKIYHNKILNTNSLFKKTTQISNT